MPTDALVWEVGLAPLVADMERYAARLEAAVLAAATVLAKDAEASAKAGAPWTDRSGDARAGLTGIMDLADQIVTIYLMHGVDYGIYLETLRGGRDAIIAPTLEALLPEVVAAIAKELG